MVQVLGVANLAADSDSEVIKATTVSGTAVMGLGPPIFLMLAWRYNSKPGADDGFRQASRREMHANVHAPSHHECRCSWGCVPARMRSTALLST